MSKRSYDNPVDTLLTLGDIRGERERPDYVGLGLAREHIPELIRMATDMDLYWAGSDTEEVWAPVHAWRALGDLRAEEAIEPLLQFFDDEQDEWPLVELPDVYGKIGPDAIPALARYLADGSRYLFGRIGASVALARIGTRYPQSRAACVEVLTGELERFRRHDPSLNAFLVSGLIDLQAREAAPIIKAAHAEGCVDTMVNGDWGAVRELLGLDDEVEPSQPEPSTPRGPLTRAQRRAAERARRKAEKTARRHQG